MRKLQLRGRGYHAVPCIARATSEARLRSSANARRLCSLFMKVFSAGCGSVSAYTPHRPCYLLHAWQSHGIKSILLSLSVYGIDSSWLSKSQSSSFPMRSCDRLRCPHWSLGLRDATSSTCHHHSPAGCCILGLLLTTISFVGHDQKVGKTALFAVIGVLGR